MLVKHQLHSSQHDNNNVDNDMATMATARRFIDDYMRRIQKGDDSSSGNFKCEITKKLKRRGEVDCNCEFVCMAKVSETMLIHEEAKK